MYRIALVIGTRPEAIKMAPLYQLLKKTDNFNPYIISTGQHKEMLLSVAKDFDISFDYDMELMTHNQSLSQFVSALIKKFDDYLRSERFDLILVHGDTITSSVIALVAFWNKILIGHVESGLRTYNLNSPYPEEANRQLTSRISNINFCPTQTALNNLLSENLNTKFNYITGNTVIDALIYMKNKIESKSSFYDEIKLKFPSAVFSKKIILVTGHRRENFGANFNSFADALRVLCKKYPDVNFVYPVHLNPNVRLVFSKDNFQLENLFLIDPLDYKSFVFIMMNSYLILTDSGGVQEEAPTLGKPVLVMRDTTERPEAIDAGCSILIGMHKDSIVHHVSRLIENEVDYQKMATVNNPYGDGQASNKIVEHLKSFFLNGNN